MTVPRPEPLLPPPARLRRIAWLVAVFWTLLMVLALGLRARDVRRETHQAGLAIARAHFAKDQVLRLWTAARGGVYVPVDEHTQPSPWLEHVPGRDVQARDGRRLTLMDPASLVQQLAAEYPELYGVTGHVTSLAPLRVENGPDDWERGALAELVAGSAEVVAFLGSGAERRLRLMRPMITRSDCVKCHPGHAGAIGSVQGGVSVTVPMPPLYAAERRGHRRALLTVGPLWLLGLLGTWASYRIVDQQVARRRQAVTALQAAYDEIRREQQIYRAGPVVVFRCRGTEGWPVEYISANVRQVLGHDAAAFLSGEVSLAQVLHPGDAARLQAESAAGDVVSPAPATPDPYRLLHRDGHTVWVLANRVTLEHRADGVAVIQGYFVDVTGWRETESAREEAFERFRALLDSLQEGVLVETAERTIVQANRVFGEMFGIGDPEALRGVDCGQAAAGAAKLFRDPDGFVAGIRAHIAAGAVVTDEELLLRDGRTFERDYVPIRLSGRRGGNMWIYRDVTARKRHEMEAVQQARLAAVGQLSAGIAHDFNNILCSIMGFTELLQAAPDTAPSAQTNLRRIADSSRRAALLVRQILDFSQRTLRQAQIVDLVSCVRETEVFLRASLPENVRIEVHVAPGSYVLEADPAQLQQMITNLAINARDAMSGGGELRLALSRGEADDPLANCGLCGLTLAGEWLRIEVSDTGTGIDESVLPLIFEPFFTTKKVGEGTGLGLSQAVGIAAQHGGHIQVRSAVGRGATFTILLPPSEAALNAPSPVPRIARGAGESILLVEDELSVNEAMSAMLRHLGYRVTSAASGLEALDCFAREDGRFDLVLTDVVMPDLDGEALCSRLRALAPGVRIIAMSGYPLGARGAALLELGAMAWMQKPIAFEQLATAVAEALSGGAMPAAGT